MALIAPWFLVGLFAIGLPLWLHRMSQDDPKRRRFGSILFLERAQQQTSTRQKLKYLLLLAARIGLLALLALLFAQPVLQSRSELPLGSVSRHHLIVLDTSLSMSSGDRWQQAVSQARTQIDRIPVGDEGQVVAASRSVNILTQPTVLQSELMQAVNTLEPDNSRLEYGDLFATLSAYAKSIEKGVVVHFITDTQKSAMPLSFSDLGPSAFAQFNLVSVDDNSSNASLYAYMETDSLLVIQIQRYSGEDALLEIPIRQLSIRANGELIDQRQVELADTETRIEVELRALGQGDNQIEVELSEADALRADDRYHLVVTRPQPLKVALFTAAFDQRDALYAETALHSLDHQEFEITRFNSRSTDDYLLSDYDFILVSDAGALSTRNQQRLTAYLADGGRVLITSGTQTATLDRIPVAEVEILGNLNSQSRNVEPLRIDRVETSHPVLADLPSWREGSIDQVTDIALSDGMQTLITASDGSPVLLEMPVTRGALLVLTTTIDNRWNNLPITAGFVPFVSGLANYLSGQANVQQQMISGDALALNSTQQIIGQVIDPAGDSLLSLADLSNRSAIRLQQPGIHRVQTERGSYLLAVNTDSRESDITGIEEDQIERWQQLPAGSVGANLAVTDSGGTANLTQFELWPLVLALFLILLIGESVYANQHLRVRREAA